MLPFVPSSQAKSPFAIHAIGGHEAKSSVALHAAGGARKKWWAGAELNCRHRDFQSRALPTELPAHSGCESREPRLRSATSPETSSGGSSEAENEGYGTEIAPECQAELAREGLLTREAGRHRFPRVCRAGPASAARTRPSGSRGRRTAGRDLDRTREGEPAHTPPPRRRPG